MSKMIAYCGLECTICPSFLATKNNDDKARARTAAYYTQTYGFNLKPEEINCNGCLPQGKKRLAYCATCRIRKCCRKKGLDHCGLCEEQPCQRLKQLHIFSPAAKKAFDALVEEISGSP